MRGEPEICLNLWYIFDDSGVCYALRARSYALSGTDAQKLSVLHRLAIDDWRTAALFPIPENYRIVSEHGTITGVFYLGDKTTEDIVALFEPALVVMQSGFPGDCTLSISDQPLLVLTPLYLHDDHTMEVRATDRQKSPEI